MPNTATVHIAPATEADVPMLGRTLAQAFHHDPVFEWVTPDADRRQAQLPAMFAAFAEVFLDHDQTYVAGEGEGAALWAPAGAEPIPAGRLEAFGERLGAVLGEDLDRGLQLQALLDERHPHQPCFYLQFIGVAPAHQGRGLGGLLLDTVLKRLDATGTPAYLEATSVHNRRLYQRHGFKVTGEITVPQGPTLWPMWRDPAG